MIKVDSFSFQGVNGAYSEQAGKNIFQTQQVYRVQLLKICLNMLDQENQKQQWFQ